MKEKHNKERASESKQIVYLKFLFYFANSMPFGNAFAHAQHMRFINRLKSLINDLKFFVYIIFFVSLLVPLQNQM